MRMRKAPMIAMAAALAVLAFGMRALAQEPAEAVTTSETRVATSISESDRMLAPVTINGAGPYAFIVDTAAERSVVTQELALELNLQPAGRSRAVTMTSARSIPLVRLPQVSFGAAPRDLNVFSVAGGNVGAAGVLGIDALRDQRVVLDFEAGEMRVGPAPRRRPEIGPDDIVVQGRRRFGQLVLADADALGVPVDVIVDSGLEVSVGNEALRRLLIQRNQTFQRVAIVSITGEALGADWTRVDNLRIGGFELQGLPVAFANAYFFERMRMKRTPALLLGMDALQIFRRVTVDFRNRNAVFVMPEGMERPAR
jgi:predicted aspartyl protease